VKRLAALLILAANPAFAGNDEMPTILRGTPAPPPPAVVEVPVPQPVIVQVPVYYPQPVYYYYFALPARRPVAIHRHHFRR